MITIPALRFLAGCLGYDTIQFCSMPRILIDVSDTKKAGKTFIKDDQIPDPIFNFNRICKGTKERQIYFFNVLSKNRQIFIEFLCLCYTCSLLKMFSATSVMDFDRYVVWWGFYPWVWYPKLSTQNYKPLWVYPQRLVILGSFGYQTRG